MSRFLNVLRSWLVMVSVIAMGNTLQSFRDHSFLSEKLYTGTPEFVNGLQARTFGIWTLLSSIIRCSCAIDIQNRTLYHITLWTFVLALGHFLSEAFIYKTAPLTIGVMAPLIVAMTTRHQWTYPSVLLLALKNMRSGSTLMSYCNTFYRLHTPLYLDCISCFLN
ncbi:ergosterol biosynthetic protein 28 homolog isoform X1 [Sebastes umbrosus]|uniref:ergosterol biosynthetic protein 28 homolog isoform X1 n=1 Tax=Sebastes umbrosus TaxID=72105 RepID=UPI00189D4D04|nr:ergosterol biosynthetic protein 28 homolog isoform X1 [Sebastes umbrosus]